MNIHTLTHPQGDEEVVICDDCIARYGKVDWYGTIAVVELTPEEANELLCGACHGPLA